MTAIHTFHCLSNYLKSRCTRRTDSYSAASGCSATECVACLPWQLHRETRRGTRIYSLHFYKHKLLFISINASLKNNEIAVLRKPGNKRNFKFKLKPRSMLYAVKIIGCTSDDYLECK